MRKNLLTIAGFDPTGGAGLQVDLKTFFVHGHQGLSVATAITEQNTLGVKKVEPLSPASVLGQIQTLAEDIQIDGIKIGMLANREVLQAVIEGVKLIQSLNPTACHTDFPPACPVVLDPVIVSSSGMPLLEPSAIQLLKEGLFPLVTLITPNLPEAELLTGLRNLNLENSAAAAKALLNLGPKAVLIKGGHLKGEATDQLFTKEAAQQFSTARLEGKDPHGTGCVLSSAILSHLAKGAPLPKAIQKAKAFVRDAIEGEITVGKGKKLLGFGYTL